MLTNRAFGTSHLPEEINFASGFLNWTQDHAANIHCTEKNLEDHIIIQVVIALGLAKPASAILCR